MAACQSQVKGASLQRKSNAAPQVGHLESTFKNLLLQTLHLLLSRSSRHPPVQERLECPSAPRSRVATPIVVCKPEPFPPPHIMLTT